MTEPHYQRGDRVVVDEPGDGDDPTVGTVVEHWVTKGDDRSGSGQSEPSPDGRAGRLYCVWTDLPPGSDPITAPIDDRVLVCRADDLSPCQNGDRDGGDGNC